MVTWLASSTLGSAVRLSMISFSISETGMLFLCGARELMFENFVYLTSSDKLLLAIV